jgi:hypothetical protein
MWKFGIRGVPLIVLAAICTWPRTGLGQEEVHLQGEIVDMVSYMTKGGSVGLEEHAQQCAKKGEPIGLLTDDSQLYLLVDDHNNPDPYDAAKALGGKRTAVTGRKFNKQAVASIVVEDVKGQ